MDSYYRKKYIKYKSKYLNELRKLNYNQRGGSKLKVGNYKNIAEFAADMKQQVCNDNFDHDDFLLPVFDPRSNFVKVKKIPSPIRPFYFNDKVPKKVHQIWFGDDTKRPTSRMTKWENWASKYNYTYKRWTEKDFSNLRGFMKPNNFSLMVDQINKTEYASAADICRYEIIYKHGGIYADADYTPPDEDFKNLIPMKGLTVSTERQGRNIGTSAIFVEIGMIIVSPNHPIIERVVDSIYENSISIDSNEFSREGGPMYRTGPFLFGKCLFGTYNIIDRKYLHSLPGFS